MSKSEFSAIPEGFVWPDGLQAILPENEQPMLAQQLSQLAQQSPSLAEQVVSSVVNGWRQKRISNPVGYLLTTLKQARAGQYRVEPAVAQTVPAMPARPTVPVRAPSAQSVPTRSTEAHIPAGQEIVKTMVAQIRQRLNQPARPLLTLSTRLKNNQ